MKRTLKITALAILTFAAACTQNPKKEKQEMDHSQMQHQDEYPNAMMQVMDEGMNAMHKVSTTGNPDYDFAVMMIPHHQAAVTMSELLLKSDADAEMAKFGNQVIDAQKKEITTLTGFLKTASKTPVPKADDFKKAMNQSMEAMMVGMNNAKLTGNTQKDYIILMIPHHQSAVDMAKAYLPYAKNEKIKQLASDVIKAQEAEISWLGKKL